MGDPLSRAGPVYEHCIFFSKNKELVPRPSIMEKSGLRRTMRRARSQGAGAGWAFRLRPLPTRPRAVRSARARAHVLTRTRTRGTRVCVHTCVHASTETTCACVNLSWRSHSSCSKAQDLRPPPSALVGRILGKLRRQHAHRKHHQGAGAFSCSLDPEHPGLPTEALGLGAGAV